MSEGASSRPSHRAMRRVAREGKAELLDWIEVQDGHYSLERRQRTRFSRYRQLLRAAGLIGLGFGAKVTSGKVTGDVAIRAYVRRKLPLGQLASNQKLPPTLAGVPTDVIPVGRPRLYAGSAFPGAAISHQKGGPGSIGAFVRTTGSNRLHILSACHVLAPHGIAAPGDPIVRPPAGETGSSQIATLADFERLDDSAPNRFDAAIAELQEGVEAGLRIPNMGVPALPPMHPVLYQSVRKQGAATLHTFGVVMDAEVDIGIGLGEEFFFTDVMSIDGTRSGFSDGGDSGSLVLDAVSSRPVGLITGGGGGTTFVSPIVRILDRFQANLAT